MTTFAPPVGPKARHLLPGSEFGDGTLGIRGGKHLGIDFQPERPGGEDWVHAVEGGVVEALFTTIKPGDLSNPLYPGHTGNLVAIRADSGRVWVYQHGKDFQVRRGQRVKAGDRLHRMWRSGRATGNHLHLGLRVDGTWRDPERVLRNHGVWPIGNDYYLPKPEPKPPVITPPPVKHPDPAPVIEKEWSDMASEAEFRKIVREETERALDRKIVTWRDSGTGDSKKFTIAQALGWLSEHWARRAAEKETTPVEEPTDG